MTAELKDFILLCPECSSEHTYKLKISYSKIAFKVHGDYRTNTTYITRKLFCPKKNYYFNSRIPVYYSDNEKIENLEVKGLPRD